MKKCSVQKLIQFKVDFWQLSTATFSAVLEIIIGLSSRTVKTQQNNFDSNRRPPLQGQRV